MVFVPDPNGYKTVNEALDALEKALESRRTNEKVRERVYKAPEGYKPLKTNSRRGKRGASK